MTTYTAKYIFDPVHFPGTVTLGPYPFKSEEEAKEWFGRHIRDKYFSGSGRVPVWDSVTKATTPERKGQEK